MQTYFFASTYGSGSYNNSSYNGATQTTTGTGTDAASGGLLANTGFDVLLVVSLACFILFVALVVRFWKRKNHTAVETSVADNSNRQL